MSGATIPTRTAALKQLVQRLRVKIEPDPANPRDIETLPNVGYTINAHLSTPSE